MKNCSLANAFHDEFRMKSCVEYLYPTVGTSG